MKKTIFLYSGEGTRSIDSSLKLIQASQYWARIEEIIQSKLGLSISEMWQQKTDMHRCPQSPLITVAAEICLSDIWKNWGYVPDVVIGHSVGELTAAYQAGFYSLEEILLLTHEIGTIAGKFDGVMLHGAMSDEQIAEMSGSLSSLNFTVEDKKHVTVSCLPDELEDFLQYYPQFQRMKPPHPWHHQCYNELAGHLTAAPAVNSSEILFASGVTGRFERKLEKIHWQQWLTQPMDFIAAMTAIKEHFNSEEFEVIEIGFHPVLEKCCQVLGPSRYASSMYRGEDEIKWILFQRKRLDQQPFIGRLNKITEKFRPGLDYSTALAYQDFTSLTFVEFSGLLQPFFPSLAPQDFYRYKSLEQLINQFGMTSTVVAQSGYQHKRNQVVITGMSCRFPATVENPRQFWKMLQSREDQVKAAPNRGDFEAGFLTAETSKFDHRYFNISEAEAKTMDPQQILALELTEMLWRDAGIDPQTLNRKRIGVYIGSWNEEYRGNRDSVYYSTGTNPSIIASRISYQYDLRGPSWVANTACSSSLLAVHYACKDIEAGRVDYAIAGGVNIIMGNTFTQVMKSSGFLSKDQRCKAFDDSANGYVRAEGGGLVLLVNKDLAEQYYAELLGSAINQNGGRAQVITAPHPEAQEELIIDACQDAAISPVDLDYVECHGTGTKIGDPIEISALQNTIGKDRKTTCFLGSVKSNIGHLESAAGIAGLLKSVLSLNYGTIPANLHFTTPNHFIDFASYNLSVVDKETPIDKQALVGVSSFGFGGANAHVILKGAEDAHRKAVHDLPSPFDKTRATPLAFYDQLQLVAETQPQSPNHIIYEPVEPVASKDIGEAVALIFLDLTGITSIDPEVELTNQGLDSLSATQFLTSLQDKFGVELDSDLLFDYPFIDDLVNFLKEKLAVNHNKEQNEQEISSDLLKN
jgi:acyl transferase domain-containing protein/acyl carrier protein